LRVEQRKGTTEKFEPAASPSTWAERAIDRTSEAGSSPRGSEEGVDAMSLTRMKALQAALELDFPLLAKEIGEAMASGGTPSASRLHEIRKVLLDFPVTAQALGMGGGGRLGAAGRKEALREVYVSFDLNHDGSVGTEEMLALGRCRQTLGQKAREWTPAMNQQMMFKMGASWPNGEVSMLNFVTYFAERLPRDDDSFRMEIESLMQCAHELNETKRGETGGERQGGEEEDDDDDFGGCSNAPHCIQLPLAVHAADNESSPASSPLPPPSLKAAGTLADRGTQPGLDKAAGTLAAGTIAPKAMISAADRGTIIPGPNPNPNPNWRHHHPRA